MMPSTLRKLVGSIPKYQVSGPLFWISVCLLALLRLMLTSDFSPHLSYALHDEGLYVARAYYLLAGEGFGPYDGRLLVKLPGMSLWLAANRMLGIPYLFSINLLYFAAGGYFLHALWRCGCGRGTLLIVAAIYLFNPVTLTDEWIRVTREPLSTCLLVIMLAAMFHLLIAARSRRIAWPHLIILAAVFAFAPLLREEDFILYGLLCFFGLALLWRTQAAGNLKSRGFAAGVGLIIVLPLACAFGANQAVRSFIQAHYGVSIMHDYGEGEFPRLVAAMRSLESKKNNRLVMITQEALARLRVEVPRLAPVIDRLPRPGLGTYSCKRYGVCSEWANGWMPFWIKDAAFDAGLTPDAASAQEFFREARLDIERACTEGRLTCRDKGHGLLPRFELRWTRAYVQEWITLAKMWLMPNLPAVGELPATFDVDNKSARIYQVVTMTHQLDTQLQAAGARADTLPQYRNALREWRQVIANIYREYVIFLEAAAAIALLFLFSRWRNLPPSSLIDIVIVFGLYTGLRLSALAYAAVYMGFFDPRLIFSTYSVTLLMCPVIIAGALGMLFPRTPIGATQQC